MHRHSVGLPSKRKFHRVGPNCETWPNTLTGNPYSSPKVGPQFGPTLYNFRSIRRRLHLTRRGAVASRDAVGPTVRFLRDERRLSPRWCVGPAERLSLRVLVYGSARPVDPAYSFMRLPGLCAPPACYQDVQCALVRAQHPLYGGDAIASDGGRGILHGS
jgi:hypothetical protein